MIYSLRGKIVDKSKETIAVDIGNIAYEVFITRIEDFRLNEDVYIYTYEVLSQDDHYLVGFTSKLEKSAFISLISVKGIGPRTALSALSSTNPEDLFRAIQSENTSYLKKLPGIGPKAAAQIVLDLKGKLVEMDEKGAPTSYEEVRLALKQLGFKVKEIDDVLSSINEPGLENDAVLRLALQKLRKKSS